MGVPMSPVPKPTRVRDEAWLGVIRRMPCCVCVHLNQVQHSVTEPNHTITKGSGGGDDSAAPMCHRHHRVWHHIGADTFAAVYGIDPRAVAIMLWAARCPEPFI